MVARAARERAASTGPFTDEQVDAVAALGQAISDPIRVRMIGMMAAGRECCSIPECGVPDKDKDAGICVCEFERVFGMGQSKVSYHMKKLKDAGLVSEEKRGRWNYYSISDAAVPEVLVGIGERLAPAEADLGEKV